MRFFWGERVAPSSAKPDAAVVSDGLELSEAALDRRRAVRERKCVRAPNDRSNYFSKGIDATRDDDVGRKIDRPGGCDDRGGATRDAQTGAVVWCAGRRAVGRR